MDVCWEHIGEGGGGVAGNTATGHEKRTPAVANTDRRREQEVDGEK